MNENLNKLVLEATKFIKVARVLLILWIIFYFVVAILSTLGVFSAGGAALYKMMPPQ